MVKINSHFYINFNLIKMNLLKSILFFRIAKEKLQPGEDGKYGDITTIALHIGPPTALSPELEKQIYCFIEDSYHMLLPRSNGRLAVDIQQYLNRIGLDVPSFMDRKPGTVVDV